MVKTKTMKNTLAAVAASVIIGGIPSTASAMDSCDTLLEDGISPTVVKTLRDSDQCLTKGGVTQSEAKKMLVEAKEAAKNKPEVKKETREDRVKRLGLKYPNGRFLDNVSISNFSKTNKFDAEVSGIDYNVNTIETNRINDLLKTKGYSIEDISEILFDGKKVKNYKSLEVLLKTDKTKINDISFIMKETGKERVARLRREVDANTIVIDESLEVKVNKPVVTPGSKKMELSAEEKMNADIKRDNTTNFRFDLTGDGVPEVLTLSDDGLTTTRNLTAAEVKQYQKANKGKNPINLEITYETDSLRGTICKQFSGACDERTVIKVDKTKSPKKFSSNSKDKITNLEGKKEKSALRTYNLQNPGLMALNSEEMLRYMLETNNIEGLESKITQPTDLIHLVDSLAFNNSITEYVMENFIVENRIVYEKVLKKGQEKVKEEDREYDTKKIKTLEGFSFSDNKELIQAYKTALSNEVSGWSIARDFILGSGIYSAYNSGGLPTIEPSLELRLSMKGNINARVLEIDKAQNSTEIENIAKESLKNFISVYSGRFDGTQTKVKDLSLKWGN